mmetsp:Transcript_10610/g.32461  ORF Transcript_10610/g.32461 Transcript_10610/m.32461 type:complete len:126 (+) Transcript_10610:152-529(+)
MARRVDLPPPTQLYDSELQELYERKYCPKMPYPILLRNASPFQLVRLIRPDEWSKTGLISALNFPIGYFIGVKTTRVSSAYLSSTIAFLGMTCYYVMKAGYRVEGQFENSREHKIIRGWNSPPSF